VSLPVPHGECALLPYQRRWVYDRTRVKAIGKSRQIGITWATAYEAVEVASMRRSEGGMDVYFMSMSREDAAQFIEDCARWIKWLSPAIGELVGASGVEQGDDWFEDEDDERLLTYRIRFPSGFTIYAMPSRPARLRGKKGYAICDEAAQQDIDLWMAAAVGLFVWGGRVSFISTFFGTDNGFYKLVQDIQSGDRAGSYHHVTIHDAVAEGLCERVYRVRGVEYDETCDDAWLAELESDAGEAWDQEFRCIATTGGSTIFARQLIERCLRLSTEECSIFELRGGSEPAVWVNGVQVDSSSKSWSDDDENAALALDRRREVKQWCDRFLAPILERVSGEGPGMSAGCDYGRNHNMSTWIYGRSSRTGVRSVRLVVEIEDLPWPEQDLVSDFILDRFHSVFLSGCGDGVGSGENSTERAKAKTNGKFRVVKITTAWHEPQFNALLKRIQAGAYELPMHFPILVSDLACLHRDGRGRIVAPQIMSKDHRKQKRHADFAYALALFDQAVREGDEKPTPTPPPTRRKNRRPLRTIKL